MASETWPLERQQRQPAVAEVTAPLWYALRVRSNFEKRTSDGLRDRGFEEFHPTYRKRSRWSDRQKWIDWPLFPGYVFCRFPVSNWLPVMQTPGVIQAIGFGSRPEPVDEREIDSLRTLVRSADLVYPRPFLRAGQKVMIKRGPLTGVEGILEAFQKECRITVSISLLQRSVSAEIDAEWVSGIQ